MKLLLTISLIFLGGCAQLVIKDENGTEVLKWNSVMKDITIGELESISHTIKARVIVEPVPMVEIETGN